MLIQTREQFDQLLQSLGKVKAIAVDTETHKFKTQAWDHKRIIGISLAWPENMFGDFHTYYLPFRHVFGGLNFGEVNLPISWIKELGDQIGKADVLTKWWNAKFDFHMFRHEGVEFLGPIEDGMIFSYMLCEWETHRLKRRGKQILGQDADFEEKKLRELEKTLGTWEQIPPVVMGKYAEKDAILTWKLIEHFKPLLEADGIAHLVPREMEYLRVLTDMQWRGIGLDVHRADELSQQAQSRLKDILDELGYDCMKDDQLAHRLFSAPPEGLGFVPGALGKPSKQFPRGRPVMDKHTLASYNCQETNLVIEARSLQKADSTWFRGFREEVDQHGRLHPPYWQHGTVTTRLKCKKPNVLQIPRVKEEEIEQGVTQKLIKSMFVATPGYQLWEFDYSQQEYRTAAVYSGEEAIIEAYRAGSDMHYLTAEKMGLSRFDGKTFNFTVLFGGGANRVSEVFKISLDEAKAYLEEFWGSYPKLAQFAMNATLAARARGWVKYWNGRKRHFRFPSEHHKAMNSIIQGGCAQMMSETQIRFKRENLPSHMVSQVYDSLWIEIPEDEVETQTKAIRSIMEDWPEEKFDIPYPVDTKRMA